MKKIICLALAVLMLLAVFVGCSKEGNKTSDSTSGDQKPKSTGYVADVPDKDYDGADFKLMCRARTANWGELVFYSEGYDGTPLNDATFDRNTKVEEDCGISLEIVEVEDASTTGGTFFRLLNENAQSGDYIADILIPGAIDACHLVSQNIFVNLQEVPYVNLQAEWWQQKLNDSVKLLGKQYFGFNDMLINDKRDTYLIYFNKDNFDDSQLEYPYQMAYDGTWTNEAMLKLITQYGGSDLNMDGLCGVDDKVPYAYLLNDTFFIGAGIKGAELDSDGYPYITKFDNKLTDVADIITRICTGSSFNAFNFGNLDDAQAVFDDDGLFMNFHMYHMATISADYESNVGIVPCPKFDEQQKEYYARSGYNGATCVAIPTSCEDKERAGIVLEVFCAESKNYISPAFYDKLFTDRYSQDDDSKKMLDTVIKAEVLDLDQIFSWGNLMVSFAASASRGQSIASSYAKLSERASKSVENTISQYFKIG